MKKEHHILVSLLIVVVAVVVVFFLLRRHVDAPEPKATALQSDTMLTGDTTFALECDGGKSMAITFHLPENKSAELSLSDGRSMSMKNTPSEGVLNYVNAKGDTILTITQTGSMVSENGQPTYSNCSPSSSEVLDN